MKKQGEEKMFKIYYTVCACLWSVRAEEELEIRLKQPDLFPQSTDGKLSCFFKYFYFRASADDS